MKLAFKKFLILCMVTIATFFAINFTNSVYATNNSTNTSTSTTNANNTAFGDCRYLLGMTSWDCGVPIIQNEADLTSSIWIIASNILIDITVIAAYLVIGYVIYGGYLYILSSGDPTKAMNGKKTLTQAFIGLAIVLLASVILSTIRIALLGANGSFADNCLNSNVCTSDGNNLITNLLQWVIGVGGIVAAVFIVIGGISYITSSGDPTKLQKAKTTIIYALIGLVIVALAEIITAFVSNLIREANTTETSYVNSSTLLIAKEHHEK